MRTYLYAIDALVDGRLRSFTGRSDCYEPLSGNEFTDFVIRDLGVDPNSAVVSLILKEER